MPSKKMLAAAAMTAALATGGVVGATLGVPGTSGAQDSSDAPAASADPTPGEGRHGRDRGAHLEAAAEAIGISVEDLREALTNGQTMAEVAEANGVDRQVVIDALVASAEARLDEMKASLPERMAEVVDGTLPERGGRGGFRGRGQGMEAAAEALGIEVSDLRSQLREGSTLAEVADAQGIDVQVVIDALVAEATEHIQSKVEAGDLTQEQADERIAELTERITERVNNPEQGPGIGGPGGHGGPDGAEAPDAEQPAEGD